MLSFPNPPLELNFTKFSLSSWKESVKEVKVAKQEAKPFQFLEQQILQEGEVENRQECNLCHEE